MFKTPARLICLLLIMLSSFSYADNSSYRIVGGYTAQSGDWPWIAAVVTSNVDSNYNAQFCGGSLIHPGWVLTAGHCFINQNTGEVDTSTMPDVVIGAYDLSKNDGQRIKVSQIVVHPSYNPILSNNNDLALLKLATPVTSVSPVLLPGQSYNTFFFTSGKASAIGWGNMAAQPVEGGGDSDYPSILQQLDNIPIISNDVCAKAIGSSITDQMLCAGFFEGGKDTCQGDSGGPLFISTSLGSGSMQIGATSFGFGCAQRGFYGVYTRLSQFSSWISEQTCSASDIPTAPTISTQVSGNNVTLSFTPVSPATHYRLYLAPAVAPYPIVYGELGTLTSISGSLPSGSHFFVAMVANNNNCVSGFSNVKEIFVP